jgi:hypothetical protein
MTDRYANMINDGGPERIWIESDGGCPYFYPEEELSDVAPPITEYVRADKLEELAAEIEALRAEVERLRKLLDRMVVCNPDGSVGVRVTEDALNAAAELYRLFGDAKKEADRG